MQVAKRVFGLVFWLVVISAIILACVVLFSKYALPMVDRYRPQIEQNLTQLTGMPVHVDGIHARMNGINVQLAASAISIDTPGRDQALSIAVLHFELDLPKTLLTLSPQFKDVVVSDVDLFLEEDGKGGINFSGLESSAKAADNTDIAVARILNYVTEQQQVSVADMRIHLNSPRFPQQTLSLPHSYLLKARSKTLLSSDIFINDARSPLEVRVEINNDLTSFLKQRITAYANVPNTRINLEWLEPLSDKGINSAMISGQYWLTYQTGRGLEVQAKSSEIEATFSNSGFINLQSDWKFKREGGVNSLSAPHIVWTDNTHSFGPTQLKGELDSESDRSYVVFDKLDAQIMSDLALRFIPKDWFLSQMLTGLDAEGTAENGAIRVWQSDEKLRYQYLSNVVGATVKGYNGIPAVKDVNAVFSLSDVEGNIEFLANQTELAFPTLYDSSWSIDRASGEVYWRKLQDAFVVSGEDLSVTHNGADIQGAFRLEQPDEREGWIALDINAQNVPIEDRLTFVPTNALSDALRDWLASNLYGGEASKVDFLLRAGLRSETPPLIRLDIDAAVDELSFDPNWPHPTNVKANVSLGSDDLTVSVKEAEFAGLPVDRLSINVPITEAGANWLNISGNVDDQASAVIGALNKTPLQESVLAPFEQWNIDGAVAGSFDVSVPLKSGLGEPLAQVELRFKNNELYIPEIDLASYVDEGMLHFSSKRGLFDTEFSVDTLGGTSNIKLSSESLADGRFVVLGQIEGDVAAKPMGQWRNLPAPIIRRLNGVTPYSAEFSINKSQRGQVDVSVSSQLEGFVSELPAPFSKRSDRELPFALGLKVFESDVLINFAAEQLAYGELLLSNSEITSGRLSLFEPLQRVEEMKTGVAFSGQTSIVNWHDWVPLISELSEAGAGTKTSTNAPMSLVVPSWIRSIDLLADSVPINEQNELSNVKLVYQASRAGNPVTLTSDELNVELKNASTLPQLHIAYLNWKTGSSSSKDSDGADPMQPGIIPSMAIKLDQVFIDNRPYGDWRADVVNLGESIRIDNISTQLPNGKFDGQIFWQGGDTPNVEVTIATSGSDAQELTSKFSPTPFIKSKSYKMDVALSWKGALVSFDRASLNGRIKFNVNDGNFNQVDQLPPFLKVLGIFNVDTLLKRLTFDFSDLYEEGMSFSEFSSVLVIREGILDTAEPVQVLSPTAEIQLAGKANLINETLDERLTATIPISSTLPVAGLLLATPQIAGLLYITDKLIGDQISKVTSIQYEIKGPFSAPNVKPVKYTPRK
ncbi:TIGR02099 family protein [Marinomonas piezotolerans]|uniref:TIGR02099 family protein n=1 Tax=Marinomonas piezotolerans TaxID=2213058 RepID=A0A370UD96_9GAMM|nr:YhdP family protein [Marinomonas piezotolerans]RDL45767.1 TIGR02099 family protein [Marinomonas piezotolerans]